MLSIIPPVLNGALFFEANLRSIGALGIDCEHIVVDGGSVAGTPELVGRQGRVGLIQQQGAEGMYAHFHQGIVASSRDSVAHINADDRIIREGFEHLHQVVSSARWDLVCANALIENAHTNSTRRVYGRLLAEPFFGYCKLKKVRT
jgi:glycosyltransferase involved in cell wall biosynthesis